MKTAIELIAEERAEQIEKHGFTVDKDAMMYKNGELLQAAIYALNRRPSEYPNSWNGWFMQKMITKSPIQRQIIAAALIAAHIDCTLKQKED